jgi:hypothetical protein
MFELPGQKVVIGIEDLYLIDLTSGVVDTTREIAEN